MKQFTHMGSIVGNNQTTPELITYVRCLPQEVGMQSEDSSVTNKYFICVIGFSQVAQEQSEVFENYKKATFVKKWDGSNESGN